MLDRPAHVLMTADAVGGVWSYALDLAGGLATQGVRVTLAVFGPAPSCGQIAAAALIPGLVLAELGGTLDWTAPTSADVDLQGIRLAMLAVDLRPDIIHLNSAALAANARFPAPLVVACHSCVRTWWDAVKGQTPLPADLAWRGQMTARGYTAADALIAPSAAFAKATARAYDLGTEPQVVLNGRGPSAQISSIGTAPSGPFALTAGRLWDEGKGMALLDIAAEKMKVPVLAAGALTGPNGAQLAPSHLNALGQLCDMEMAGWFAARPIFVSTALYEPFGLAVLEAAKAGCPLVLSDIATFRELWDGCALFVDPRDPDAVAAAVESLAGDDSRRERLGSAAMERAGVYTQDKMTNATLTIYQALMANVRHRRGAA